MTQALYSLPHIAIWRTVERWLAIGIALFMLMGALITPWGLTQSHGAAALAVMDHEKAWKSDDGHGHSHDDATLVHTGNHAHHAGDHSHDHVYVLPLGPLGLNKATAVWQEHSIHAGPWPSLDGLERPPRT